MVRERLEGIYGLVLETENRGCGIGASESIEKYHKGEIGQEADESIVVCVIYVPRLLILGLSRENCNSHLEMKYFEMGHFSYAFFQFSVWNKTLKMESTINLISTDFDF